MGQLTKTHGIPITTSNDRSRLSEGSHVMPVFIQCNKLKCYICVTNAYN